LLIRGQRVMLDSTLAGLYGVETKALKRAVNRNRDRFPTDFMFSLTYQELANLRCQIGTSSLHGGHRYRHYVFTEQGVAMLSSVLRSRRAIQVNIEIMRAFVRLKRMIASHEKLAHKIDKMEKKYDSQFKVVFDAIRKLMNPPHPPKNRIGF
jgi:hypothetical protein